MGRCGCCSLNQLVPHLPCGKHTMITNRSALRSSLLGRVGLSAPRARWGCHSPHGSPASQHRAAARALQMGTATCGGCLSAQCPVVPIPMDTQRAWVTTPLGDQCCRAGLCTAPSCAWGREPGTQVSWKDRAPQTAGCWCRGKTSPGMGGSNCLGQIPARHI